MGAANYYSQDFEWDKLRQEIENNPSLALHLLPYPNPNTQNQDTLSLLSSPIEDPEAWNKFHTRHSTGKFFKERRYLLKEFPELASCRKCSTVLEVGCGNGSTALPILRGNKSISLYACDCSEEALERAKENIEAALLAMKVSSRSRMCAFQMQEAAVSKISPIHRYLPRTTAALAE